MKGIVDREGVYIFGEMYFPHLGFLQAPIRYDGITVLNDRTFPFQGKRPRLRINVIHDQLLPVFQAEDQLLPPGRGKADIETQGHARKLQKNGHSPHGQCALSRGKKKPSIQFGFRMQICACVLS